MKIKFRYRYDHLQEMIINRLYDTEVKFRIRADRTIEFAKKWYPEVDNEANEIRFEIFQNPVIRTWKESIDISGVLYKLADKNIPFIIENHDGIEWIIYDKMDVEAFCQAERDLGLHQFHLI